MSPNDGFIYIPTRFGLPEDGIYAVMRQVKSYLVKDIVWRREGKWVSLDGKPLPDENIKSWAKE